MSVITKVLLYQVKCISYFVRCHFAVYPFVYPFVEVENAFCVTSVENATVDRIMNDDMGSRPLFIKHKMFEKKKPHRLYNLRLQGSMLNMFVALL